MSTTQPGPERTLGQLVASASQDFATILRGEIALAKSEVSGQVKKAGLGGALLAGAGVLAFYSVYFIFITIAEGITAAGLWKWLSYLIVTVFFLLVAGILALIGIRRLKTVKPAPERAIANAQQAVAALKRATSNPYTPGYVALPAVPVPTGTTTPTTSGANPGPGTPGSASPVPPTEAMPTADPTSDRPGAAPGPTAASTDELTGTARDAVASGTSAEPVPRTRAEAKAQQQNHTDPHRDA